MNLTHAPLVPVTEAEIIHGWVVEERAQFWMMGDHTLEEVREIYTWIDEQSTHAAYLVRDGDTPVALFQTYEPGAEEVGEHVEVRPGDVGAHFMLAPAVVARPGHTAEVTGYLLRWLFDDPALLRLVVEPDARNAKAVGLAERLGFTRDRVVELSTKPAQLMFLTREAYESRFSKNASA